MTIEESLARKVKHCDEIMEERDQALKERDEARVEVERLTDERDEAQSQQAIAGANYVIAMDALEVATRERDKARAEVSTAYRRGAEAMREACAKVDPYHAHRSNAAFARSVDSPASVVRIMQEAIRALPVPEEP
jgi:uncharacterized protein (DUF3084 family)